MTYQTEMAISAALRKIGGSKENDPCKYLSGGEAAICTLSP